MELEEKNKRILELKNYISELEFKAKASVLKAKYSKDVSETLSIAWQNVYYATQIRITYAQIQSIMAIPTFKNGGDK